MNLAAFNRMARRLISFQLSSVHDERFYTVEDENEFVKLYFYVVDIDEYIVYHVKKEIFEARDKYPKSQYTDMKERLKDAESHLYYNCPKKLNEINKKYRDYFSSVEIVDNKQLVSILRSANIYRGTIKRLFMEDGDEYTDSELVFRHRGWTIKLFNKDLNRTDIIHYLNQVEKRLGSRLKYLCYGNVNFLEEDLVESPFAFYNKAKDDITILDYRTTVYTFIHELGHRLYGKFLNDKQKESIHKKYDEYVFKRSEIPFKKGDIVKTFNGLTLRVLNDEAYVSHGISYILCRLLDDTHDKTKLNIGEVRYYNLSKEKVKYVNKKRVPIDFPTGYSMTQHEEFFSDMFSTWCFNRLNSVDKVWIEGLLFNNNYGVKE